MSDGPKPKFQRATDDELRKNGFDPEWIEKDSERDGPFAPIRCDTTCSQCGHKTFGWTVVNLMTATGISQDWTCEDGEVEVQEAAEALNAAWLEGFIAAKTKDSSDV